MGLYNVHNLKEGSRDGNWIRFWEEMTGMSAANCRVIGCSSKATDGAHVQLDNPNNDKWYIVPICHSCNCQRGAHVTVWGPLVPVNGGPILW